MQERERVISETQNRSEKLSQLSSMIEHDLCIDAVTAIEDKLARVTTSLFMLSLCFLV